MSELAPGVDAQVPGASKLVAGFWIRLVADLLDTIILGVFGFCLALPFRNLLFRLGESGVWIGLVVTFLYAGLLQSAIGHGQSLAKRALRIQVLKMNGHYLSLRSSLLRYTVIALIFYSAWIGLALTSVFPMLNHPAFQTAYTAGVIVLIVGTVLMVPLHPLKRGIHDIISGSIVVYKGTYDAERIALLSDPAKIRRAHLVCGVCGLLVIVGTLVLGKQIASSTMFNRLLSVQAAVGQETELKNVSVTEFSFATFGKERKTTKTIVVNGFLNKERYDNQDIQDAAALRAANVVISASASLGDFDGINVVVRTGFNIGIANLSQSQEHRFSREGLPVRSGSR